MKTANHFHHDTEADPHTLLIVELQMGVSKRDQDIYALNTRYEYLLSHYQLLVSECAFLYSMHGAPYAVASLNADATHRLPESVMRDVRRALGPIA